MQNDYAERYRSLFIALSNKDFSQASGFLSKQDNTFYSFINTYIDVHGLVRQSIMRRADIPVSYGYKLLTGDKHTKNRNVIIRLCVAMDMPIDDVQKALSLYEMSSLGDSNRDRIIITGIIYRQSVDEINEWLVSMEMEPLMDGYDR